MGHMAIALDRLGAYSILAVPTHLCRCPQAICSASLYLPSFRMCWGFCVKKSGLLSNSEHV